MRILKRGFAAAAALCLAVSLAGCGSSTTDAVPVQSVELITSMNKDTQQQIFLGVVSTGNEANIKKDSDRSVSKVYVKTGDQVKEGDKLFTYDSQQAQNNLDKAKLELEEQQNTLQSKQEEKKQLETDKAKASSSEQLDYTLKIQEADTDIREAQYNIGLKEKEIERLQASTQNLDVTAPFDGSVEYAGTADASTGGTAITSDDSSVDAVDNTDTTDDSSGSDSGNSDAFIRIVETDNYRVKGTLNETNINSVYEGMSMIIHSRTDDTKTWTGEVSKVDTQGPSSTNSDDTSMDGSSDGGASTTSSYAFYVTIDSLDGLMIGQHVYMTESTGDDPEDGSINLSASFINDADSDSPWVWAEKDGVLEKRSVTLGEYNSEKDTYPILEGLTEKDYIAAPSESLEEGMPVEENDAQTFRNYVDSLTDTTNGSGTDSSSDSSMDEGDAVDETVDETVTDDSIDTVDETDSTYADGEADSGDAFDGTGLSESQVDSILGDVEG